MEIVGVIDGLMDGGLVSMLASSRRENVLGSLTASVAMTGW
jgi:hypothetical protein